MTRRLVATYIALAVIVLLALAIPLGIELARNERRALASNVERDAFALASLVEDRVPPRGRADVAVVRSFARTYARDTGTRVVVVDARGKALADTASPRARRAQLREPAGDHRRRSGGTSRRARGRRRRSARRCSSSRCP